ncbi:non-hydrolyzing UDP-N-acetylglucosamine 2-epimerase [Natroniella sp. ANB-PHB2]|uniref:non-hydrolyzing UDP-N-acetylglucosamine 2-epimerase n=1 Tax=Natroniella sp. ANB-PHB2 TaxID=3384444 RepID=UPI0038D3CA2B
MKVVTIVGARPQFIKAAPVSRELSKENQEILVHTGQHYDQNMSDIFFKELNIPKPDYNLGIGSDSHGKQTGKMLAEIEEVILEEKPDVLLVYGDTNSTIAGALAASKLLIPVIHIEAGLRSYNKDMPEEQNRILTDHISKLLFCPTETAVKNLKKEGITQGVENVGDVMYDAVLYNVELSKQKSDILEELGVEAKGYILATVHRAENTNSKERLKNIVQAFNDSNEHIVLPLHPRTKNYLEKYDLQFNDNVQIIEPVGYLDMLMLESNSKKILTDSGGVQKEAYFLKVPCITMRDETEWIETVDYGWNFLVSANYELILDKIKNFNGGNEIIKCFGNGDASQKIVNAMVETI